MLKKKWWLMAPAVGAAFFYLGWQAATSLQLTALAERIERETKEKQQVFCEAGAFKALSTTLG